MYVCDFVLRVLIWTSIIYYGFWKYLTVKNDSFISSVFVFRTVRVS
jgi:hypothetical protein